MAVGYLVGVAFVACGAAFALRPLSRPRFVSTASFYLGLGFNELPFVALSYLLMVTLLTAARGDIASPTGWAGLGLAVLAAGALAVVIRRGLRARPTIDAALDAGLGAGWRGSIEADLAGQLRRRLPWVRILLGPFRVRRRDVERTANIRYGDAGKSHLLDVYRRRSHPTGAPVLIHFHGGSFQRGHKDREARPLLYHLASQGWVCISANYRLRPGAVFPDHLIDVKQVIAWARVHGHEYGADPGVLFVAGSSAGGYLAAIAALTPNDPMFQPGFEDVDTSVSGAVGLYGYYGGIQSRVDAPSSPLAYLGPDAPPFFVAHGDLDPLVSVEATRTFVEQLRAASNNPVVYAELPGGHHSFDLFHSVRFEAVIDGIEAFASWVRSH